MNEHRDIQPRRRLPDRIELGIVQLEPACRRLLRARRPKPFMISPAPARPPSRRPRAARQSSRPNPGPTLAEVDVVNITIRSLYRLARMASSACLQPIAGRAVGVDHHLQIERRPSRRPTRSNASGAIGVGGWPWKSMTGNLARGTGCCGTTSVERGLYSRMFGGGNSGSRPSAGRGRICPGGCGLAARPAERPQRGHDSDDRGVRDRRLAATLAMRDDARLTEESVAASRKPNSVRLRPPSRPCGRCGELRR